MFEEIYVWLESFSGTTYGFEDDVKYLNENHDLAFIDTFEWKTKLVGMLDTLSDMLDDIDTAEDFIPDDLPNKENMKRTITSQILGDILSQIESVKKQMGISSDTGNISTYTELVLNINTVTDLIGMIKQNSMETISSKSLFDKYNDENDNAFVDVLELSKNDIANIWSTVHSIIEISESDEY